MNENDAPVQDAQPDTRFDDELARFSAEAAHRVMHNIPDAQGWEVVKSDHLDASKPLDSLSRKLVTEAAAGTVENVHQLHVSKAKAEKLEEEARVDEKTGLRTFSAFKDDLPRAIALAEREKTALVLWQIDGQGLKKVNDNISRAAGDQYITIIAEVLEGCVRRSDGVYRGGKESDEFFVLMPSIHETEENIADFLALKTEEIRAALAKVAQDDMLLHTAHAKGWIGLSIGATYRDFSEARVHRSARELSVELLADADREMRFDKRKKRIDARNRLIERGEEVPEDDRLY